eukprot:6801384-Pyramimonas_sp.AAC.1
MQSNAKQALSCDAMRSYGKRCPAATAATGANEPARLAPGPSGDRGNGRQGARRTSAGARLP